jgi:potassium/hydrogen antiporter
MAIEYILLGVSTLLLLSIVASKASGRLGVPALVLFLLIGMLAGSDGPGGIHFDDPWLAQFLGIVALSYILFAGGLETEWNSIRPVLWSGLALSTVGVLLTAVAVGWFATILLDFSLLEGFLLGAIVSSTDAAAVFAVLRSRNVSLKGSLKPLLELESGSNDPMAVLLTIGFVQLLSDPQASFLALLPGLVGQVIVGTVFGYGMGKGMLLLVNHVRLEYEGLYPVLTLTLVLLTYGITASLGGNAFLAVYIAGLVVGNHNFIHKKSLLHFHNGIAWLMQITMFLTLGLLVFPSQLVPIATTGLIVAIFLMVVARPVSVFATLLFSRLGLKERVMVAWVGLRGAVPIILATFPLLAGLPKADIIFNIVFFIVLTSVLLQGTSIPLVARWLGVDAPMPQKSWSPLELVSVGNFNSELTEVIIPAHSPVVGSQIVHLNLPTGTLIVLLKRDEEILIPSGSTVLAAGDTLLVLADSVALVEVRTLLSSGVSSVGERVAKRDETVMNSG